MTLLAINWVSVGSKTAQLILSLSILVILHEFGHYITARWFKCRVEKFYLFFDPWFSLVKKKIGDTEYGIGWLPLGGYVKISGMVDESMDKEAMKLPPQTWEFRSKPAWQRLIIMLGGVTVNVLLAFFIYAMILFVWGEQKIVNNSFKNGIYCADSLLLKFGLNNGDKIIAINGQQIKYFDDIPAKMITALNVTVEQNGRQKTLLMPVDLIGQLVEKKKQGVGFIEFRRNAIVGDLSDKMFDTMYAKKAGLQRMDKIISVDSVPVTFVDEMGKLVEKKRNDSVTIEVDRNGEKLALRSRVNSDGKIGLPWINLYEMDSLGLIKIDEKKYSLLEAFPAGVAKTWEKLSGYVDQFKKMANPKTGAYKGMGGFKTIGSVFPTPWDWESFWNITAFLSIVLAFMNLLPIPALDGGHVLFTLGEMITGRKPSEKFLEYAQVVGMVLLLSLMLFANGNDWFGWGRSR
ncbi:RIP metalloprotease RseP [Ferruginibacter sp.]|uniref:RIP metalloprotease RseP n=1 Tax=Ferruginibacter sp. TaxID=1940288 RepID=UPI0019C3A836|nr:RIP metalloprotease RseP [Ferruginibacter sp.]MBC7627889.1 RIP metalloprotease RseP [Ferruginibacter sp.]